jgi:hypothetical protein
MTASTGGREKRKSGGKTDDDRKKVSFAKTFEVAKAHVAKIEQQAVDSTSGEETE